MNCTRVDHVGIAVKDLAASVKWYEETLGLHSKGTEVVQEQQVTVAFLPCGDSELELLESTSPEGPIARFIEKNGEGIQHIAIRVDDIDAALAELRKRASGSLTRRRGTAPAGPGSPSSTPRLPTVSCWNCVKGSEDNDYGGKAGSA